VRREAWTVVRDAWSVESVVPPGLSSHYRILTHRWNRWAIFTASL